MLPVLQLGPFAVQTYPLALVLAGWAALAIGARVARSSADGAPDDALVGEGIDGDHIYNAGLYGLLGGIIVGRLAHVIAFWPAYRSQPLEIIGLNASTFLAWPGLIAGLAVAGWYVYKHRLPLVPLLDAFAPGLLIGLAIADIGALLAGRNPGAPADLPWSVTLWGVRRHPVQIYEALGLFLVALLVISAIQAGSRKGIPALIALLGWGLVEWLAEAFRAPEVTSTLMGGLRLGQVLGLAAALAALAGLRHLATRGEDQPVVS